MKLPVSFSFDKIPIGLINILRDITSQINSVSEGRISAFHSAQSSAPTTGTWKPGDFVLNSSPSVGEYRGWVYGVSSFIGVDQIGVLKNTSANRPTKVMLGVANDADWAGYLYLDTTLDVDGKPVWWTGIAWVDATGLVV